MPITWRPATWNDIEHWLSIQPKYRGDALVGVTPALDMEARDSRSIFLFRCARVEFTPSKPSNGGIRHFGVRLICIRSC